MFCRNDNIWTDSKTWYIIIAVAERTWNWRGIFRYVGMFFWIAIFCHHWTYCIITVSIPPEVNPADCVASFIPALKCYTPLRTFVNHKANETALISCHNDLNLLCITLQLCQYWNFKVIIFGVSINSQEKINVMYRTYIVSFTFQSIVVASDDNEERVLKSLSNNYTKIIRFMGNSSSSKVVDEIMDYTHGIGASIVFDLG